MPSITDFTVLNHGSIFIFIANNAQSRQWFDDNTDATPWGKSGYVVEHRYAHSIAQTLRDEGFSLS